MFVRLSVREGVHCDDNVLVCVEIGLWLDSQMFWAPWHKACYLPTLSRIFPVSPGREMGCAII